MCQRPQAFEIADWMLVQTSESSFWVSNRCLPCTHSLHTFGKLYATVWGRDRKHDFAQFDHQPAHSVSLLKIWRWNKTNLMGTEKWAHTHNGALKYNLYWTPWIGMCFYSFPHLLPMEMKQFFIRSLLNTDSSINLSSALWVTAFH